MHVSDWPTPQVLIDRSRLLNNLDRAQALAAAAALRLRPHAKTHKSPIIARWQIERGAVGICCAKLGEAETFAQGGITDIRLPYPVQPSNARRLLSLMDRATISIIVDDVGVAEGWSQVMRHAGRTLDVLVKVDVGFHRCGIDPESPDAVDRIAEISGFKGLRLRGVLSHAGHGYGAHTDGELMDIARKEAEILNELAEQAIHRGVEIPEVSVGATPTYRYSVKERGLTEIRPGNYVYYDRTQVALGAATLSDCAMTVMATVVSKPTPDRLILDCGSKTLTTDVARGFSTPAGFGAVLSDEGRVDEHLAIERLSEEHATVRALASTSLRIGDRVRVLPNHACVVANMVDQVLLVDGEHVLEALPVAARGRTA